MSNLKVLLRKSWSAIKEPSSIIEMWQSIYSVFLLKKDNEVRRICRWNYGAIFRQPVTELFPGIEETNIRIQRAYDRTKNTSIDLHELVSLVAILNFLDAKSILEIGTFDGNTTLNMALNTSDDARITTVDLPLDWNKNLEIEVPGEYDNITDRTRVGQQFQNTSFERRITQIFGDSTKIDFDQFSEGFDAVFIDGCHHYEYVKKDTYNAMKVLKETGIIIWHDYGMVKDVSAVVDETAEHIEVKAIQGTRLAVGFMNQKK